MDRIIQMILNKLLNRAVNTAVDSGVNYLSGKNKPKSEMSEAEKEQARNAGELQKRAQEAARNVKRFGR